MAHSVSGYVLYVSMWFNTKFVRVPNFLRTTYFLARPKLTFFAFLKSPAVCLTQMAGIFSVVVMIGLFCVIFA